MISFSEELLQLNPYFYGQFKNMSEEKGLVIKSTGSWYEVQNAAGEIVPCRMKGKFKMAGLRTTNPIAVGDLVEFKPEGEDRGVITKIESRKNYIIRRSTNLSKQAHIIAANIDQAYLIVTLASPPTSTGFIDRFLVTAEAYHIPVTIVFNKIDLHTDAEDAEMEALWQIYTSIGYRCLSLSAIDETSLGELKAKLTDHVNLLSGHSGVGKSTLINQLVPGLDLRTDEVSDYHKKGKHTTTFAEMHQLPDGGFLVDTPGIKGFGVIDLDKAELSHYFPEMRDRLEDCQFHNCVHINEPKCGIKAAVEAGEIAMHRYENYLAIYHEDESQSYR